MVYLRRTPQRVLEKVMVMKRIQLLLVLALALAATAAYAHQEGGGSSGGDAEGDYRQCILDAVQSGSGDVALKECGLTQVQIGCIDMQKNSREIDFEACGL